MILIALTGLCLLTVPIAGGDLRRLADLGIRAGFDNSAHVAHPLLPWLGDVIPWPGPVPDVLSIGDCVIYAGVLVLAHRVCARARAGSAGAERPSSSLVTARHAGG